MIHFLYLVGFALLVSIAFAVFTNGDNREKFISGLKTFGQFIAVSLVLAWIFYFLPW
jgi:glucan phosphoethanolaminetransferase (alkaline phosphatase superfamily)